MNIGMNEVIVIAICVWAVERMVTAVFGRSDCKCKCKHCTGEECDDE